MEDVKIEDLSGVYREIAEELGLEAALKLGEMFGGGSPYFPKLSRALIGRRNARIYGEFTGANHAELAVKHNPTLRHVYKIVKEESARRRRDAAGRPEGAA